MTTGTTQRPTWDAAVVPRRRGITPPSQWPAHWPLTLLVVGFPLWWVLGLAAIMPVLVAIPMALDLWRRHPIRLVRGFGWWAVFLVCVALSVTMLFVDAPGAVPGGGPSRLVVFTFRLMWYLACTVVLLWVLNLDERELPTRRVVRLMGTMFVITVAGGLLGVLAPTFEFTSPVEAMLPGALRSNSFVLSLVHPAAAAVQSILGSASPRPIAPFAFANSWGANLSMFLPFFLLGWFARDAGWRRAAAPVVLVLAAVPVVLSLNRGLWLSLALGAVYFLIRLVVTGRIAAILGAGLIAVVLGGVVLASPLGDMVANRLETPHSNERRGELLSATVEATATGSPVLGFGSTRDVQGSFASIAGGSRPDCPACAVPPLGTQGQIWLVVFAQGFVGLVAFVGFYVLQFAQHWRSRTPIESVGVCLLLFFGLQLFVYDTLGMPMFTLMIAIALMARERAVQNRWRSLPTLEGTWARLRASAAVILGLALMGGLLGGVVAWRWTPTYDATASVLLAPSPLYLDPLAGDDEAQEITVDTEASMVYSEQAVQQVRSQLGLPPGYDVRGAVRVTAPVNSRVLQITARSEDPARAEQIADAAATAFLAVRSEYLAQRREQVREQLEGQLASVAGRSVVLTPDGEQEGGPVAPVLAEDEVRAALRSLALLSTDAGRQLRPAQAEPVRRQVEVPVVSGMLVGALIGLGVMSWRDAGARRAGRPRPRSRAGTGERAEG